MVSLGVFQLPVTISLSTVWKLCTSPFEAALRATGVFAPAGLPDVDLSDRVVIVTGANTGEDDSTRVHLIFEG